MVEPLREFYVRTAGVKEVGGRPVKMRGQDRVVLLTAAQAEYWLDQGAIGQSPGETPVGSALGRKPHEPAAAPRQRAHAEHPEHTRNRRKKEQQETAQNE
jgi:hypothetical protein